MSEEGIAKGVRRIVAVTADDAAAAIAEGDKLLDQVEKAAALPDAELEQVREIRLAHSAPDKQAPLTASHGDAYLQPKATVRGVV